MIVNKKKTPALDLSRGLQEFLMKPFSIASLVKSIPVSYTCSVVAGRDGESEDRIYAAHRILLSAAVPNSVFAIWQESMR